MVVEDDTEMNALQRELMEVNGLEAVAAYTGAEALDQASQCCADAVLLDVMLPGRDGFDVCKCLRKSIGTSLPIIIVTALDSEDCRKRGFEAGADAYFAKPFDPDEIVATIRMLIDARADDEASESDSAD